MKKLLQRILGGILFFVAINAFGGGYYGIAGAKGIPLEWLKGSPFTSYFLPALFLFAVVGGLCLYSAIAVFKQWKSALTCAFMSGILLLSWILVQIYVIGYVSWMQPAIFITGLTILALTWLLRSEKKSLN